MAGSKDTDAVKGSAQEPHIPKVHIRIFPELYSPKAPKPKSPDPEFLQVRQVPSGASHRLPRRCRCDLARRRGRRGRKVWGFGEFGKGEGGLVAFRGFGGLGCFTDFRVFKGLGGVWGSLGFRRFRGNSSITTPL